MVKPPPPSAPAGGKPKRRSKTRQKSGHPWRDNIEAVTVSIVIIVLFKYFVLEAYKIPTGSMQPTLMGWDNPKGGGIKDRVLVDKLSYHFRDPERFEVVVFRYPLDRSKNFIKRIVGMPNEVLMIKHGDLWHAPEGEDERILRRPAGVLNDQLKKLRTEDEWTGEGRWSEDDGDLVLEGPGRLSFPRTHKSVRDHYRDGYPGKMGPKLAISGKRSGTNDVGDLRVAARVTARAETTSVFVEFTEDRRTYRLRVPGPAAAEDARPSIIVDDPLDPAGPRAVTADAPRRLRAGSALSIRASNIDDLLVLEIDGEEVARTEIGAVPTQTGARLRLGTEGGGARFARVGVWRDIYYTTERQKRTRWTIPAGNYVMLGDNTQDSSDSRDWQFARWALPAEDVEGESDRIVRGNQRNGENPRFATDDSGNSMVFFHDELGERWVFPRRGREPLPPEPMSFVPRELIRGRAVVVLWPLVPGMDVWRLKWVR